MAQELTPAQAVRLVASRRGGLSALAKELRLPGARPVGTVWAWIDRDNVPPEHAAAIEQLEGGFVAVEQLTRGVRWRRVANPNWPHPDGEPLIVAAPAPAQAEGAPAPATTEQAGG